jgi:hypothetical protein
MHKMPVLSIIFILTVVTCSAREKVRVFVTDSQSWETKGSSGLSDATGGGAFSGGARPQNAEIAKTFGERCPQLTVTINRDKANYIVTLDHEGGKHLIQKDNKWVVYNGEGDMIGSGSTRSLGNSVKDACSTIVKDNLR